MFYPEKESLLNQKSTVDEFNRLHHEFPRQLILLFLASLP
jgi:hypothetical protein